MEALADPNISVIGVVDNNLSYLCDVVEMRNRREDHLFGAIVTATIRKIPDLARIQQEIAGQLGLTLQEPQTKTTHCCVVFPNRMEKKMKKKAEVMIESYATQLSTRIRAEPNILFILKDVHTALDYAKLGIPFGDDYPSCKIMLISHIEEVLSIQNNIKCIFRPQASP